MDGVLCDCETPYKQLKSEQEPYPQSRTGFYEHLEPLENAIEAVNLLRKHHDVYILTAPSVYNPKSYTEKRLWIEKHFDLDFCHNLILCYDKSLLKGDILIDDMTNKNQENFEGIHVMHVDWELSNKYLEGIEFLRNTDEIIKKGTPFTCVKHKTEDFNYGTVYRQLIDATTIEVIGTWYRNSVPRDTAELLISPEEAIQWSW